MLSPQDALPILLEELVDSPEGVARLLGEARQHLEDVRGLVEDDLRGVAGAREDLGHVLDVGGGDLPAARVHEDRREAPDHILLRIERRRQGVRGRSHFLAPAEVEVRDEAAVVVPPELPKVEAQQRGDANACHRLLLPKLRELHDEGEGQVPARGVSGDGDGNAGPLGPGPPYRGQGVLQALRKLHERRLPVVHREDTRACDRRESADELAVHVRAEEPVPAAVEVQDDAALVSARRQRPQPAHALGDLHLVIPRAAAARGRRDAEARRHTVDGHPHAAQREGPNRGGHGTVRALRCATPRAMD
eukprot:CAMPEP_0176232252 /NCGR_PEP_ID=MMETSP0121_2-20121125/25217_1 /TAXON_ID=160619 /ORGANISM="Kryptoperidinium foliaceum, Strain CCMP 1326" /LENGTH=304 /DNA_ID=CAMNT_0017571617 /DNA_START=428 /DNA_END=1339 /DNA_ORIENTATION=+